MATAGQSLTDVQQRDEFHRVIALHYENVADLLRELTIYKLSQNNKSTIQIFKQNCLAELQKRANKKIINQSQLKILNSPSLGLNDMDVTMLTMCLLNCGNVVSLDPSETKLIKSLRERRNDIAHNLTGRLSDKTLFNKTGQYCIQLSQNLPAPFQHSLKASIDELKQREFVRRISTLEILKINVEQLEVVLLQHEERDDEGDTLNVIILKYNLAKWAKQISREINIDILLKALKKKKVIQKDVYRRITEVKCECDKAPMLIDHFIKEKSRVDILRLLDEFRSSNKALIADLIENNNSDGRNTQTAFMDELMKTLKGVLIANVRKIEGKSETAEDLHAFIEEHLGYQLDFNIVDDAVHSVFTIRVKDKRYLNICDTNYKFNRTKLHNSQ